MIAAVLNAKEDITIVDRPEPVIEAPDEVIVKVRLAGVCGSDHHMYHGENPFAVLPRVMGHELVGEVAEMGSQVSGVESLAIGDHVVVEPISYCGKCYACRNGMPNVCSHLKVMGVHADGGMQEYVKVPAIQVHRISKEVPWKTAVLAEPYTIAGNSTMRARVGLGMTVVVQGAGTIGQLVLRVAKAKGATVLISDVIDEKLAFARENGADRVVNAAREDLVEAVRDWTDGEMANAVIDAAGFPKTFESSLDLASVAGAIVPLGMSATPSAIPNKTIMQKQLTICGSRLQAYQFAPIIKGLESHQFGDDGVVNQKFGIRDVQAALDLMDNHPERVRKIVLNFD